MTSIIREKFGSTQKGEQCELFTLEGSTGIRVKITNFGASLVELICPDRNGNRNNITLSLDSIEAYESHSLYFGAIIGRYANRINRGQYTINKQSIQLESNDGAHTLHGASSNFATKVWQVDQCHSDNGVPELHLSLISPDGCGGFPGRLVSSAIFRLEKNILSLDIHAESDKLTPVSISYHPYWNLNGTEQKQDTLNSHTFQFFTSHFTPSDHALIPTGELRNTTNTIFDFSQPKKITDYLMPHSPELLAADGFDHNFCFTDLSTTLRKQAKVYDHESGRAMLISSTLPGFQFYTGNHLDKVNQSKYSAFCIEPQFFPDSPNQASFPFEWTEPTRPFKHRIEWQFDVENPA